MTNINSKIHFRVAAGVTSGSLLFAMIVAAAFLIISYQQQVTQTEARIKQRLADTGFVESVIANINNGAKLTDTLMLIESLPSVQSVCLRHKDGRITKTPSTQRPVLLDAVLTLPILLANGESAGKIEVIIDKSKINNNVFESVKSQILLLFFYSAAVAFLTLVIVSRLLTEPMKQIASHFHQIKPGDQKLVETPSGNENNEVGALVSDINTLLRSVHQKIENERNMNVKNEALSRKFRFIFERASAGIGLIDESNSLVVSNPALMRLLGQTVIAEPSSFKDADFLTFFNNVDEIKSVLEEFRAKSGNSFTSIDILLKRKLKNPDRWVHCLFSKVEDMDDPDATLIELVVYDITERAEREQSIIFEAEHDPITHLLNRRAAMSKLSSALRHVEEAGRYFALMMIDLDGFKRVNDTYGHDAGDKVIIEVAKCIRQFFRNSDIVARWGGDEFLIGFSYSPEYESAVRDIANDLQFQIAMPVDIGHEQTAKVGSSIGISLFPQNSKNLHTLIEQADHAMYHVKNNGKNFYHFYTEEKHQLKSK